LGHRLIGAMYRGESIGFLNAMIRGQSLHPLTAYLAAGDKLMRVGAVLILAAISRTASLDITPPYTACRRGP